MWVTTIFTFRSRSGIVNELTAPAAGAINGGKSLRDPFRGSGTIFSGEHGPEHDHQQRRPQHGSDAVATGADGQPTYHENLVKCGQKMRKSVRPRTT